MKNIPKILIFCFCFITFCADAQSAREPSADDFVGTTWEEYNYLTKGYRIQIESGLDMKKGYKLVFIADHAHIFDGIKRRMRFSALIRDKESSPCAILMVYKNLKSEQSEYVCIPNHMANYGIWEAYNEKLKNFQKDALLAITWSVTKIAAYYADGRYGAGLEKAQPVAPPSGTGRF
jgi:hypothetical protein